MRVTYRIGDITDSTAEAIVNAANPTLLGGGGVDGAIHRAAGPELKRACLTVPELEPNIRCRVGKAVCTPGFELLAEYVIHTVGPIYPAGRAAKYPGEEKAVEIDGANAKLADCISNCLKQARRLGINSIAFPAISCGVYGCSPITFGRILHEVLKEKNWGVDEVEVVLFGDDEYGQFLTGWTGEPAA